MNRTLLVTNDFPPRPGGIQSYLESYLDHLDPAAITVLASTFRGAESTAYDATRPYRVERVPTRMLLPTPGLASRIRALAAETGSEVVWFGAAAPLAVLAPEVRGGSVRKVVASTHGHEVGWSMLPGSRQVLGVVGRHTDEVTYVSQYTRARFSAAFGPRARLVHQPGGVDTERFCPDPERRAAIRERYGLTDRRVVLCLSRLVPRKGQDTLIRALPAVLAEQPDAALAIVGGGPYRSRLEKLADEMGVRESVLFTGRIPADEVPDHHRLADVFAMPCRTRGAGLDVEGLGIAYLEASASGVPVVAGRSGGAPEAVEDGITGTVVDGRATDQVAEAVAGLLADRRRASRMGTAGRAWTLERWRWEILAEGMERVLSI